MRQRIRRRVYKSRDEACQVVFEYREIFCIPKSKHSANGMVLTPSCVICLRCIRCKQVHRAADDKENGQYQGVNR
jgi:hypothetical protein